MAKCLRCGAGNEWIEGYVPKASRSSANFLWPFKAGSVEEAAYEFCNAATEAYRKQWWGILKSRFEEITP